MKASICTRMSLACSIGLLFAFSAHAKELNGAWVKNVKDWSKRVSICSKGLLKENNKVVAYDSRIFIIDGNEIRGKSATCHIKARKDDGNFVRLLVDCPAQVAENVLELRIESSDELTRIIPGMPEMNTPYFRCPQ